MLLTEGRAVDVERMIAPLLEKTEADDDDWRTLHVLMARVELLHHGHSKTAHERLTALTEVDPQSRVATEILLWRGWAALETDEHRALRLLDRAAQAFRRLAEPTGLAWARIGQARAYLTLDELALARLPLRQVSMLQASLQSVPMREWIHRLEQVLPEPLSPDLPPNDFVAADPAMQSILAELPALACTHLPVLLSGEPGTGKAHLARILHTGAPDPSGPFVVLDCSGAPSELVTCQLLGESGHAGALQEAEGGTLFLRAVDRLPRAAQEGLFARLQETHPDVRLLASTHRDLAAEAQADRFLEPLLDTMAPTKLHLPPLRTRRLDITLLVRCFLDALCPPPAPRPALTDRAQEALLRYDWPGNVRQLRNEIDRALVLLQSEPTPVIDLATLSPALSAEVLLTNGAASAPTHTLDAALARAEKTLIERVLRAQGGQVSASANVLGLTRQGLYKKMKRLDIDAAHFQAATG